MAVRKTTGKTSKKASLNLDVNLSKPTKRNKKKAKNAIKKINPLTIVLSFIFILTGVAGGFLGFKFLTKNDCFNIIGQDEITLQIGESYVDEGVNIIAFNKDVSEDVIIETNLKKDDNGSYYAEEEGTFYILYKSNNFKYNSLFKIQKIRLVTFVEATEETEINKGGNNE